MMGLGLGAFSTSSSPHSSSLGWIPWVWGHLKFANLKAEGMYVYPNLLDHHLVPLDGAVPLINQFLCNPAGKSLVRL